MTRVYIAASSREPERVRRAQLLAREWSWEITLDWLTPMEANLARGVRDVDLSPEEQRRHARDDLAAIEHAGVFWLLAPREPTKGAWVEFGYAMGVLEWAPAYPSPLDRIVVSGCTEDALPSIFCALADSIVKRDEDVGDVVRGWR